MYFKNNKIYFSSQYWCVDKYTGTEIPGTRTSISPLAPTIPDCLIRHKCLFNCLNKKEESSCKYGFKLDHRGCFDNENCECRNPCETFKCSLPESEVCILKQTKCLAPPCASIPKCILNICTNSKLLNSFDENKNIKICTKNSTECNDDEEEECLFLPEILEEENKEEIIGLCCKRRRGGVEEQKKLLDSTETKLIALQSETQIQTTTEEILTPTTILEESIDENDYKCENTKHPALNKLLKLPIYCNPNEENNFCPANFKCIRKPFLEGERDKLGICCELIKENEVEKEGEELINNNKREFKEEENKEENNICFLPINEGIIINNNKNNKLKKEENICDKSIELRYFYNLIENKCEEFIYAGCGGNKNNFHTKEECENQCIGVNNLKIKYELNNNLNEHFTIGLTLIPVENKEEIEEMERSLRSYLAFKFNLKENNIQKLRIERSSGNVFFDIVDNNGREKIKNIAENLASGQFQFTHNGQLYIAQTNNWVVKQIKLEEEKEEEKEKDEEIIFKKELKNNLVTRKGGGIFWGNY
ncbi:unnamed protein product [Meloidogyne enterolobii]|uniref:Uncharacterized protein n=1 Tax=Meloidogyne enterolobii TaxID=390850 RepID=A0ACB0YH38_MELEN